MHPIQEQLIKLSADRDVASMKLVDLAQILGVKHLEQIKHHRGQLIKKGLIAAPQTARTPRIIKDQLGDGSDLLAIPVLGLSLIHISEPTRQAEISYAVFCLKKKK